MPLKSDEPKEWEFDVPTPEGVVCCKVRMIRSSNIEWVGWPRTVEQTPLLFVQFKGGSRYVYLGVTRQKAVALAYSPSTGSYFAKNIRGKYKSLKIR